MYGHVMLKAHTMNLKQRHHALAFLTTCFNLNSLLHAHFIDEYGFTGKKKSTKEQAEK